ncbi:MAG: DUF2304 domain-containing protein [Oscillospiraceae bacterium]|nr:DUF2304 domain-containing protein [Oscillospiraceae bacterium]
MNPVLQIFFIICIVVFLLIIIRYLTKKQLNLKYSLVWLAAAGCMLILALFPQLVEKIGNLVGIATPVSTVFVFAGMFMLLIILTLTIIVSHMNNRIYRLTQMQAILEKRVRELESKNEK